MSDFLNNFSSDKYTGPDSLDKKEEPKQPLDETASEEKPKSEPKPEVKKEMPKPEKSRRVEYQQEETEIDPTYEKKKRNKRIVLVLLILLLLAGSAFAYFKLTRVDMPDFVGKPISEVKLWGVQNKITLNLEPEFSLEQPANTVISQPTEAGKKVRKGSSITLKTSKGADPQEHIELPDFSTMPESSAQAWIDENKAENIRIVNQYHDTIEEGKYIKFEISDPNITKEQYKREDSAVLYYSRGKETYQKNIDVPNYVGKNKSDVESWAKSNEIDLKIEEEPSSQYEPDLVIRQSVPPSEKIAKKDSMTITVSLGKAMVVPDFREFTAESAANFGDFTYQISNVYSRDVDYGFLISQSIAPGTKLTSKDDKTIRLVYSLGRPFMEDLSGSHNVGQLQEYFYTNFQSKGANITYSYEYRDNDAPRGTIIAQSIFGQFLPMEFNVHFYISNGGISSPDDGKGGGNRGDNLK